MTPLTTSPYLRLLRNQIGISRVPFSDRGSRLMVFREVDQSRLLVKPAERLTALQPDLDSYRSRPPFTRDLCFVDAAGNPLGFDVETYPHVAFFHTRLGDFGLVFHDRRTLSIGLPPEVTAGLRFHVSPQFWEETGQGGVFKSIRNLAYASNGEIERNCIAPERGGYTVEFVVQTGDDCAIALAAAERPDLNFEVLPFSISHTAAENRWHNWFNCLPPVQERYRHAYAYAWWIMANNLISPQGKVADEAMTPSKISYVGLWLWDSAKHALAHRHADPERARDHIRALLACQLPDGMFPDPYTTKQ